MHLHINLPITPVPGMTINIPSVTGLPIWLFKGMDILDSAGNAEIDRVIIFNDVVKVFV